jgi:predicted DCC family thiol-disulfide oxidoreductase YuxK
MVSFYRARKPELEVVFDAQSGLAFGFCRLMKPLDALSRLTFVAGEVELVAVRDRKSSRVYSGGASVRRLLRALPFTGWASFALGAPGIAWLVDRIFDFVARRRSGIGAWFGMKPIAAREGAPSIRFDETARHAIARAFVIGREALAVMLLVVCGVALGRDMNDESAPSGLEAAIYRLVAYPRMYQRWGLFAPDPERRPGTLVAEAETAGGTKLDPFTGQPAHAAAPRPEPLMGSYFTSISQPSRAIYVNELREYVRRRGERGGPSDQLVRFNVDWIESPIAAPIPRDEPAPEIAAVPITPRRITSGP